MTHYKFDSLYNEYHSWYPVIHKRKIKYRADKYFKLAANFHHLRTPTFIPTYPLPLIIYFQKKPFASQLILTPTCLFGTLEYIKITIYATLQLQWHGFIKLFYSNESSVSSFQENIWNLWRISCYRFLLHFWLLSCSKTLTKNYMRSC